jgi:aquaporin Z
MAPQQNKRRTAYLMEAVGIAGFVIIGGLAAIFSEHPNMPLMESPLKDYPTLRRVPMGLLLGVYIFIISKLFSKRSGTHINPAVTLTFYRLGTMNVGNVGWYLASQFLGAITGAFLLKFSLDKWFSHPNIHYGITKPLEPHTNTEAFIAEWIISFITMWVILVGSSSKKLEKKLPVFIGVLIALFIIVEMPFSGMSMNPARSLAGAAAANQWHQLWIYFVAPIFAMLVAGELYLVWKRKKISADVLTSNSEKEDLQKLKEHPMV